MAPILPFPADVIVAITLHTFIEFAMVDCPAFTVGFTLSLIIPEIQVFPISAAISRCPSYPYCIRARHGLKPWVCRLNFDHIFSTFRDISTSGLGGHVAISGCSSSSKLLSLKSLWSILSGVQSKRNKLNVFLSKRLGVFPSMPKMYAYK